MASKEPSDDSVVATESQAEAERLRACGREHFQAERFDEAARCYREALEQIPQGGRDAEASALGQKIRLNLALCLHRLDTCPEEALRLCEEALAIDPQNTKALFWRGSLRQDLAKRTSAENAALQRETLTLARQDFLHAARLEPGNRQFRDKLEEVTEFIKAISGAGSDGLRLGLGSGMYDDREAGIPRPPSPPMICSVCGREGHPRCGKSFWIDERAVWLRMPPDQVAQDPATFEDDGNLRVAILAARAQEALERAPAIVAGGGSGEAAGCSRGSGRAAIRDEDGELVDLSDDAVETLEDCLDAVERPYPNLKRPIPLPQAVRCAEELWAED
jgi:tetratricopeptide (TPR) repeat protein